MTIDTTNMCSHLQKKLFEPEGVYYPIWQAMQDDETLTAVVRSRQLHIYRNGKKILVLAGKAQPKIIREDKIQELITSNPQPIGFSGILLAKRQNSFYCTYFLHNRNVADTKSPYPIKRLEVIRWFNQKSMVFNQSLS